MDSKEAKSLIIDIGKRMYAAGFVAANDGNISIKISDNEIWATPSGVSKGYMTEDMLVKVDINGTVLEGSRKPSSELKMHLRAYKENDSLRCVCHAHPPIATAFGVAGIAMNEPIISETVLTLGSVPVVPYVELGTDKVADVIAPYCKSHGGVMLANHGAVTWAEDPYTAYYRLESMEHYGKIYMYTKTLGNSNCLTVEDVDALIKQREKFGIHITARPEL